MSGFGLLHAVEWESTDIWATPSSSVCLCAAPDPRSKTVRKATNVPGVVAFRDSDGPATVVTMTTESWAMFTHAVKAGEYDVTT